MLKNKILIILVTGLLVVGFAQPVMAVESSLKATVKLNPKKITSRSALEKLLKSHHTNYFNRFLYDTMAAAPPTASNTATTPSVSHSDTNIQVQGVDESDTVKVGDDGYLYQIYNNQIRVVKGFPITELSQTAMINFADTNFYPSGIYIQNGKLAIVGTSWQTLASPEAGKTTADMPYYGWWFWNRYSQTRVLVYDVSDHASPKQIRDVAVDGDYLDSRRVNDNLYFISRNYPRYYLYNGLDNSAKLKLSNMLPTISDVQPTGKKRKFLPLSDIAYFPKFVEPNYVIASSINLAHPEQDVVTKAYLGAGEMIYASAQNLYLSASQYNFNGGNETTPPTHISTTQIFKFAINAGQINFSAAGEVPGTALNQFSMDEKGDYFRIATTVHDWVSGTNQSTNALFVLNKDMKIVGTLDNLAKGEQIYSTRFLGNRCYMVTFRLVDPLFAIDLSVPEKPTVLGELKIPGYSNYLHPYDETHLIGFGKDAAVYQSEQATADQFWAGGSAFYQGLKVALFDVADMSHPKELHSVTIGDRGSSSPLLWNHKALYWDAERHLFGFPVELYQLPKPFDPKQPWAYGQPVSQAAYIYQVTPESGFTLKAKLSQLPADVAPIHVTVQGYDYSYWDWTASNWFVDRMLRIENNLYTLSNNQISVYDLANYQLQTHLPFKP
jgi:uncharacterized secreted protein with C-terminal beta-propeller domain